MVTATFLVVTLAFGASRLGPAWSGALSSLPIFTAVLAAFSHSQDGSPAAFVMLKAAIVGTLGSVVFFGVIGTLLAPGTFVVTHLVGTAATATVSSMLGSVPYL